MDIVIKPFLLNRVKQENNHEESGQGWVWTEEVAWP
jgi:hypothetical protein